jgi:tRNA A-37 threonylcarbamoyl transferase component Bud32/tetratricopeptide (TPR) repeat protein
MIQSKERDSGGFNQKAESTTAPEVVDENANITSNQNPLINTLFAEKYLMLEVLGEGGMSIVYLARHEAMNKLVAIKTLHTHLMSKTTSLMRFKQEAQAASRLEHPGIVAIHDYGITEDGTPYLVMDYVQGESLGDLLNRIKSLPDADALNIFKQTTAAISHAHQRGVVHRDIKPSNIMLNFDERNILTVKIVDFGVAKLVEGEDAKLTQTGESLGSPLYMSPEQCLGQQLDVRSDIYSFGCVMYEALLGVPALASDSVFKTMMKHIHEMPPSFKDVRRDLKHFDALERIVFKAIAKEPGKRYQKMEEILSDLNNLHEEQGIAQRIVQSFELTGLRKTTKSLNFMVASSLLIGALILFGTQYILASISAVSTAPFLESEPVIWSRYADRGNGEQVQTDPKGTQKVLGSLQSMMIESDEQAARQLDPRFFSERQLNLAFERRSKAEAERNQRHYDTAQSDYAASIAYLSKFVDQTKDIQHANILNNLILAYVGAGDCAYFNEAVDYKTAAQNYHNALVLIRKCRNSNIPSELSPNEQLHLFLRNADCYFMQGNYTESEKARQVIADLQRSDRSTRDASYKSLNDSKISEEYFRGNRLPDAKDCYLIALEEWTKKGDNFLREQAIAAGRLAEVKDSLNVEPKNDIYSQFIELAEKVARTNPEKLRSPFFSNAYQSYAHYLWQHGQLLKAFQMHELAQKYGS